VLAKLVCSLAAAGGGVSMPPAGLAALPVATAPALPGLGFPEQAELCYSLAFLGVGPPQVGAGGVGV
jgi:hypothetical protein